MPARRNVAAEAATHKERVNFRTLKSEGCGTRAEGEGGFTTEDAEFAEYEAEALMLRPLFL